MEDDLSTNRRRRTKEITILFWKTEEGATPMEAIVPKDRRLLFERKRKTRER
jgi:hypothetical protein